MTTNELASVVFNFILAKRRPYQLNFCFLLKDDRIVIDLRHRKIKISL